MDHASKDTLKNMAAGKGVDVCGSESTDLGGAARIAPIIYCYRENLDEMLTAVKAQTALTHRGPGAVDGALFLARSSFAILHGATPRDAVKEAVTHVTDNADLYSRLDKCLKPSESSTSQMVKEFGQMCAINAALPGAVYTVLKNEDNLQEALIETVMAGGDSAARGMVVGMLLGAYHGTEKIPRPWLDKLNKYKKIITALKTLP
jgi:ADP-ribosylglycohydrolase